jgi:hypothetical protein
MVLKGIFGFFHKKGKWNILGEYHTAPNNSIFIVVGHAKEVFLTIADTWKGEDKSDIALSLLSRSKYSGMIVLGSGYRTTSKKNW